MGVLDRWRYCPRCRSGLEHGEGRVDCRACGFTGYANSAPTASAVCLDDSGRILLARRAGDPFAGLWDVPGGFLEEGEEPLAGLRRELLEETGLQIEPRDFIGAFVDWYGEPRGAEVIATLNLVWRARVIAGQARAADDVTELVWFTPCGLPGREELAFTRVAEVLEPFRTRDER